MRRINKEQIKGCVQVFSGGGLREWRDVEGRVGFHVDDRYGFYFPFVASYCPICGRRVNFELNFVDEIPPEVYGAAGCKHLWDLDTVMYVDMTKEEFASMCGLRIVWVERGRGRFWYFHK